jgi:hypothetical protein
VEAGNPPLADAMREPTRRSAAGSHADAAARASQPRIAAGVGVDVGSAERVDLLRLALTAQPCTRRSHVLQQGLPLRRTPLALTPKEREC